MKLVGIFGGNVRAVRRQKGWTQERLAFEAGVKRAYVSEIEGGKRNPTLDIVEKLAVALDAAPAALLAPDIDGKTRESGTG